MNQRLTLDYTDVRQQAYKGTWDGKNITLTWHFAGGFTVRRRGKPAYYARISHFPSFYEPKQLTKALEPKLAEHWQEPQDA